MKLFYNGFDLGSVGDLSLTQAREFEGGEQTQRARVRLSVKLELFARSYDENRQLIESARAALALPNAVLQWTNDAAGVDYLNQTAVLVSEDLPEEWGEYHQTVNLVFTYFEQAPGGAANNVPLYFSKAGSAKPYQFDVVNKWQHAASNERFSTLRSHRRETRGRVRVEGQVLADTTLPLADRRTALATAAGELTRQLNSAEGRLRFGEGGSVFDKLVRLEDFTCDLDQLVNALNFSFSASYTLFPNELDYATAEYTADERDPQTGEITLSVAGRIQAATEAAAQAKLTAILTQVVAERGYLAGQLLELDATPNAISANADGNTFTELNFSARYRKWRATNQPATLQGIPMGSVTGWTDKVDTTRFSPLRRQRERTTGAIDARGTWTADPTLKVAERRAQLLARQRALKAQAVSAEAVLVYGDWSQPVRVASFTAEIDQAETGIGWQLSGSYTLFPNEASYATAEYTVAESDPFTGEVHLGISGRIQAQSELAARAKLAAILTAALASRGYATIGQALKLDTTPNAIEADADGATFTELSFSAEYRRWKTTNLAATFGGGPAVPLGQVHKWHDRVSTTRFSPLRALPERITGTIDAAGCWAADPQLALADRRAQLLARQRALKAAVQAPEDLLQYGDWSHRVRVTECSAEINQAETGLEWSLTASYTLFPDEASYTTSEFSCDEKDPFTGETTLTVAGKVQAASESAARIALAALLTATVAARGYGGGQQLSSEAHPTTVANDLGTIFTELGFGVTWRKWKSTNQVATFAKTNGGSALRLGSVARWRDHYTAQRFSDLRSQRRHATGSVDAAGTLPGDMSLDVAARRAALLAQQRALKASVNGADGTLAYGDWSQVVRVEDFQAEVNQAETGIEWSLSASYSMFPNEGGYATAEFTVTGRESVEEGDEYLAFTGRIGAPSAALAAAKLASLRTTVLASYGWALAQRLRADSSSQLVYANGDTTAGGADAADGTSFLELSFSEDYRRRLTGALVGSTLQVSSREDLTSQTLQTTYAGSVTATGPNADAAYATALARAQALGASRETAIDSTTFLRGSTLAFEQRQLTAASPTEFVRLTFSYEYQSKLTAGRAYLELTTTVQRDSFGTDMETCAGFVAARDAAAAQVIYLAQVRAVYASRLIHAEQTGLAEIRNQVGGSYNAQHVKLDFNLQVFAAKVTGSVGLRYSVEIARDFLTLEMRSTVQGSCFAANRAVADAAVTALVTGLNLGNSVRSRRNEDRERNGAGLDVMLKVDFTEEIVGRVTGDSGVIELRLTESVVHSGIRWAAQHLPFDPSGSDGVSIVQPAGHEPGSRTISGSVTCGTRATAETWAKRQRALLTGDRLGNKHAQPEKWEAEFTWAARTDGIVSGATANVQVVRVTFTFAEILPYYPAPS